MRGTFLKYSEANVDELNNDLNECFWRVMDIYDDINVTTDYVV